MACGLALKRPLELESLHSPEGVKRARMSPFRPSSFSPSSSASPPPNHAPATSASSVFAAAPPSRLSQHQLQSYLTAEIKALRRRKVLPASRSLKRKAGKPEEEYRTHPASSGSDSEGESSAAKPTFTFSQVQQICERLLREQEERLRAQYDALLYQRLSEQYETFVKFTQDQIHRNAVDEAPSYLS